MKWKATKKIALCGSLFPRLKGGSYEKKQFVCVSVCVRVKGHVQKNYPIYKIDQSDIEGHKIDQSDVENDKIDQSDQRYSGVQK